MQTLAQIDTLCYSQMSVESQRHTHDQNQKSTSYNICNQTGSINAGSVIIIINNSVIKWKLL